MVEISSISQCRKVPEVSRIILEIPFLPNWKQKHSLKKMDFFIWKKLSVEKPKTTPLKLAKRFFQARNFF